MADKAKLPLNSTTGTETFHAVEVAQGERFEFGRNWRRFLSVITEERVRIAVDSLDGFLEQRSLKGLTFLDIGCGSGLSGLAAVRLGATVHSFDYDPEAVLCALELERRFCPGAGWTIEQGSILDEKYLAGLRKHDVVYAWGVLHHTGDMWKAIENAAGLVRPGGLLHIAIYNDCGKKSLRWRKLKKLYCELPRLLKLPYALALISVGEMRALAYYLFRQRSFGVYIRTWTRYQSSRGMSRWHDWIDWIGGYPYEFATVERVAAFMEARKFTLAKVTPSSSTVCNEFLFQAPPATR